VQVCPLLALPNVVTHELEKKRTPAAPASAFRAAPEPEPESALPAAEHDFSTIPVYPEADEEADDGGDGPGHGHIGRTIIYGDFRAHLDTLFARLTNREFRKHFREWKHSPDQYEILRDKTSTDRLIDAKPVVDETVGAGTASEHVHYDVKYSHVGSAEDHVPQDDMPGNVSQDDEPEDDVHQDDVPKDDVPKHHVRKMKRRLPSFRRKPGKKRGWGMANRVEQTNGFHILSFGIGDYNQFNVLGGDQKGKRISPYTNALIAYVGRSRHGRPAAFIAIGTGFRKGGGWVSTPESRKRWWRELKRKLRKRKLRRRKLRGM